MKKASSNLVQYWIAPAAAAAVLYGVFQLAASQLLGVTLQPKAISADLALHCVAAIVLRALSRSTAVFLALIALLMGMVHLGNGMKIAVLGGPVMPDDTASLRSLLLLLEGGWLWLAWALGLALALLFAAALTLRPRRARIAAATVASLVGVVTWVPQPLVSGMDRVFGNVVWDQQANYGWRGPLVHMLQESARYSARRDAPPHLGAVMAATETLMPSIQPASLTAEMARGAADDQRRPGRNVHMIVLESFWDPSVLEEASFSRDPFVKEFRTLWNATGRSRALSPVFGGYTANAEFEALCGFPVTEDAVFFEGRLRNEAPCLPRALGELGYRTIASHPNVAVFWNRVNAYRRVGFETYWSEKDFELDDMNGPFLGDASLYRQVLEKVEPLLEGPTPTFNYVLTYFGHLDYPLGDSRPAVIKVRQGDERLQLYANTVHYKSRELMEILGRLRKRDPDAIIVMFGDHLPFLGPNFESYTASGVLAPNRAEFADRMFVDMHATPLVVIDGRRGPLRLGDLPLYHLPSVILELLGRPATSPMELTRTSADFRVRPLPGMHLVLGAEGEIAVCRGQPEEPLLCGMGASWLDAARTVGTDLFAGSQHLLRQNLLPPAVVPPFPEREPLDGRTTVSAARSRPG